MAIQRLDNVGIVVDDLAAATAFFLELGMEQVGEGMLEGLWADRTVGLDGVRSEVSILRTPDGHVRLELMKYHAPAAVGGDPKASANTLGMHRVMFAVDDIEDVVDRLRPHGAELIGEVTKVGDTYQLCYLRGPAGIIVALAQQLS